MSFLPVTERLTDSDTDEKQEVFCVLGLLRTKNL